MKRTPCEAELDGIRLDQLKPGTVREVSALVGAWLVAKRYAFPEMRRMRGDNRTARYDSPDTETVFSGAESPRRRSSDY